MTIKLFGKEIIVDLKISLLVVAAAMMLLGAAFFTAMNQKDEVFIQTEESAGNKTDKEEKDGVAVSPTITTQAVKTPEPQIRVYVSGCVKKSGVVSLKKGSIIEEAVKAAGGATAEADLESINLAYELSDNDMVKIPSRKSKTTELDVSSGNKDTGSNPTLPVVKDSGGAVPSAPGTSNGNKAGGIININKATIEELDSLPNIGIETAKDIIEFREKNGGFKTTADIMKISGIKESRYSKIKDRICVD